MLNLSANVTAAVLCSYRYNVVTPPDSAWGAELPNGSWTGMMGQVTRKVRVSVPVVVLNLKECEVPGTSLLAPLSLLSCIIGKDSLLGSKICGRNHPYSEIFSLISIFWKNDIISAHICANTSIFIKTDSRRRSPLSSCFLVTDFYRRYFFFPKLLEASYFSVFIDVA